MPAINQSLVLPNELREWLTDILMKSNEQSNAFNQPIPSRASKLARVNAEIDQLDITVELIKQLQAMRDDALSLNRMHDLMINEMRLSTTRITQSNIQDNSLIGELGLEDCIHSNDLNDLSNLAYHLNCSDIDHSSLLQAVTRYYMQTPNPFSQSNDELAHESEQQALREVAQQHERLQSKQIAVESSNQSIDQSNHQSAITQLPSLAQMQAELAAYERKRADYETRLSLASIHCKQLGVDDTLSWSAINGLNQTVKSKSTLRDTLAHELALLNELPSDPSLAREKINEAWAEVARMERDIEMHIQGFGAMQ